MVSFVAERRPKKYTMPPRMNMPAAIEPTHVIQRDGSMPGIHGAANE